MSSPLSDTRLADAAREVAVKMLGGIAPGMTGINLAAEVAEKVTAPYAAELDRVRAEAAASCPADCPCRSTPLPARWDKEVVHPTPGDTECPDTLVCCIAATGQPVAVWLDDEHREALALALMDPNGEMDQADDTDEPAFAVVFDRPDPGRIYAWGPFADRATAARFAEFVHTEIDPARVTTWEDAKALPGVRVSDPVAELLTWRSSIALPPTTDSGDEWVRCRRPDCSNGEWLKRAEERGWAYLHTDAWLCSKHAAAAREIGAGQ